MVEVNGRRIEDVDRFVYLGATVSKEGGGNEDIHNRVVKARGVSLEIEKDLEYQQHQPTNQSQAI